MLGKQRSKEFPWHTPRVTTKPGNNLAITDTLLFYLVFILKGRTTKFKRVAKWDILRGNEDKSVGLGSVLVVGVGSGLNHS